MMKIAICDDDRDTRFQLSRYVKAFPVPCVAEEFDSGERLLASKESFDLIFLDIDMRGINGIETARKLRNYDKRVKIVYVTAYQDYVNYAFSVHAFGYLVKPVKKEDIFRQMQEAVSYTREEEPAVLVRFETEEGMKELDIKEIYYFEYTCRKIQMKTKAGCYWLKGSITELAKKMENYGFCMPHKSFTVNLYFVKSIKGYDITMVDDSLIPLSQKKSVQFREKLSGFLASQI